MKILIGFLAIFGAISLIFLLAFLFGCLIVGRDDYYDE